MICVGTICDGKAETGWRKFRRVLALGLLAAAISPLAGQIVLPLPYPAPPGLPAGLPGPGNQNGDQNAETRKLQQRMEKARNEKRQRELVRDTNALLDLARRLDAQIRGSTGESLTPEQIKLTAEIEKLAKSVETKMKGP